MLEHDAIGVSTVRQYRVLGGDIVDLSVALGPGTIVPPLSTVAYDPGFEIEVLRDHDTPGAQGQVIRGLHMRLHVGTHVDAPEHYVRHGSQVHDLPLDTFVGPVVIADATRIGRDAPIDPEFLEHEVGTRVSEGARLLIRTGWSSEFGGPDWHAGSPFMTDAGVDWIASRRLALLGVDFAHSKDQPDSAARYYLTRRLCAAGTAVLANLRLDHVDATSGWLMAAPIRLEGVEAAPVRALLIPDRQ